MTRLRRSAASVIATLAAALLLPSPAWATNDGQLCSGIGLLLCAPLALVQALQPKSAADHLRDAVREGDLDRVKRLMKRDDPGLPTPQQTLQLAIAAYLDKADAALDARHLAVVQHLVSQMDVSGDQGTPLLQMAVSDSHDLLKPADSNATHRLTLARLLLEHGASASGVMLNECRGCEVDDDFLPLLIHHGADPDRTSQTNGSTLLDNLLSRGHLDAAGRLVRLGANPNGSGWGKRGMLSRIADSCNLKRMRTYLTPERFEADSRICSAQVNERISFAVRQLGADPNGRASPATECVTPYESALDAGNVALAQTLVSLGADVDLGRRCRAALRAASPGPALQ